MNQQYNDNLHFFMLYHKMKKPKNSQQAHEYLELSNLLSSFTK